MSSQFERDYVLRLVKQLAALLAAILKLKQEKKYDQALEQLQSTFPSFFGIEYRTLVAVDSASAAQLLDQPAKIKVMARLLEAEAELYESLGNEVRAAAKRAHALELYVEAALRDPGDAAVVAAIDALLRKVRPDQLGEKYQLWLRLQSYSTAG